jgi:protein-S-isoprenylcysteine O-methyltransferase Ste14
MWISYFFYWWAMSRDVKVTVRRESARSRLTRLALMVGAAALLIDPSVPPRVLDERFLPSSDVWFWGGAAVTAMGLLFSVWARRHLGKNWSQAVTVKESHELIQSGPYALVRHPIYTGLLLGFAGSAIACGEWRGLLAVILVFWALWSKARLEERWMRAQFGKSYEVYSRRVTMLVPYII